MRILSAIIVALVLVATNAHADPVIGQPAPELSGAQLDNKQFNLAAQHGKVVIVNFWARWCGPCREEMPALDAVYKNHKKDLIIVGVSMDKERNRDDVVKIMKGVSYPGMMFIDLKSNGYGWPDALPTTYIIGKDGVLSSQIPADKTPIKQADLENMLQPLLNQQHLVDKKP